MMAGAHAPESAADRCPAPVDRVKTLILMRHAKSDWSQSGSADFTRPLNKRGRRAAPVMGAYLREHGLAPSLALVSSAVRTRETWERMREALGPAARDHELRRELYLARPHTILDAINDVDRDVAHLLVLGHNPGMGLCAPLLAAPEQDEAGVAALAEIRTKFPTAAIAVLRFADIPWADIQFGTGRLTDFVTPAKLGA
jgi:phosphohistidine phosphatase